MIEEDYVSFEVAKLLKENGFDGECMSMYITPKPHAGMGNPNEAKIAPHGRDSHYYDGYLYQCEAPTLEMAMKWLRKEKGIAITPIVTSILDDEKFLWDIEIIVAKTHDTYHQGWRYESYEGAAETALKFCLKDLV